MTDEDKKESAQKDFKESFEAVMNPVVDWLNLKPDNARTARFTFCYVNTEVELSQGVGSYSFDSSTIKGH